jgi:hypothetical protein
VLRDDPVRFVKAHPHAVEELGLDRQEPALMEIQGPDGAPVEVVGIIPGDGITLRWYPASYGCFGICPPPAEPDNG